MLGEISDRDRNVRVIGASYILFPEVSAFALSIFADV